MEEDGQDNQSPESNGESPTTQLLEKRNRSIDYIRDLPGKRRQEFKVGELDAASVSRILFEDTLKPLHCQIAMPDSRSSDRPALGIVQIGFSSKDGFQPYFKKKGIDVFNNDTQRKISGLRDSGFIFTRSDFGNLVITSDQGDQMAIEVRRENEDEITGSSIVAVDNANLGEFIGVANAFFPETGLTQEQLQQLINEKARLTASEDEGYVALIEVAKFLADPDIKDKMDKDLAHAVEIADSLPSEDREKALEILAASIDNLPNILADYFTGEMNGDHQSFVAKAKEVFLQQSDQMVLSRAGDDIDNLTEMNAIVSGQSLKSLYAAIMNPKSGDQYTVNRVKPRVQYRYAEQVALCCNYSIGDIDHPDTSYSGGREKHLLSFVDAKLAQSFLDAEDALYDTRRSSRYSGSHLIEGRYTDGPILIKPDDITDIVVTKELEEVAPVKKLKELSPQIKIITQA